MTDQISIWRWQIEGDLDAQFAKLLAADADQFTVLAAQMFGDGAADVPSLSETQTETEARIRAMGLPDDVLQTTLEGFRAMVAEAEEEQAALDEEQFDVDDGDRGGEGRVGATLASSHMFFDDPYASLEYEEIDRQVEMALGSYKAAISNALGNAGQSYAGYLGVTSEQLNARAACDAQLAAGVEGAVWVWARGDAAFYLSYWQEDKELPIDLEFHRIAAAQFEALREKL